MRTLTASRLNVLYDEFLDTVRQFIIRHKITEGEYQQILGFVAELGQSGEAPLLMDVFLGVTVDDLTYEHLNRLGGTRSNLVGPFYLEGAPLRPRPYRLGRDNEPGDTLYLSGSVRDAKTGAPIASALLDVWQTAGNGQYDHIDPDQPDFNMRGKFVADGEGRFEIRTVVPEAYQIPVNGPTGRMLAALDKPAWRPKHIHVKLSGDGYVPLTTQLYFEDDPWLDKDIVAGAPKPELTTRLEKHDRPDEIAEKDVDRPFYTARYDFRLVPAS